MEITAAHCRQKRVRNDYGAGGGNFIGVCVGMDVDSGAGEACGDSAGDSIGMGACDGATVAAACGDDTGDACDAMARRSLENGISAIRATSIGTTIAAITARFVQNKIFEPWLITSSW